MNTDTIFYAILAIVIAVRLWSVLGRRNEEDGERPNPFVTPEKPLIPPRDDEHFTGVKPADIPPILRPLRAAPDSLAGGLEQIKVIDSPFDEKQFLQGARAAFIMVIEDFFKGDLSSSTGFLGGAVRANFQSAIATRRTSGHTVYNILVKVKDVECAAARVDKKQAFITVRYVSEQILITRDASGAIVSGEEGKSEEVIDLWTFTRDTSAADPNWMLIETKA